MDERKRIAIYGGTFDPVHVGHLAIARRVSEIFEIDDFLFVPARVAPHKTNRPVTSGFHRYAMLVLATESDQRVCVSQVELEGPGPQYTVHTLESFRERFGEDAELFFVMGADSWSEITTWREWKRLLTQANLVVVTRPGAVMESDPARDDAANIVDLRGVRRQFTEALQCCQVFLTDAVMIDASATNVRRAVKENDEETLKKLVPMEVANYIRKYGLYRNRNED